MGTAKPRFFPFSSFQTISYACASHFQNTVNSLQNKKDDIICTNNRSCPMTGRRTNVYLLRLLVFIFRLTSVAGKN